MLYRSLNVSCVNLMISNLDKNFCVMNFFILRITSQLDCVELLRRKYMHCDAPSSAGNDLKTILFQKKGLSINSYEKDFQGT